VSFTSTISSRGHEPVGETHHPRLAVHAAIADEARHHAPVHLAYVPDRVPRFGRGGIDDELFADAGHQRQAAGGATWRLLRRRLPHRSANQQ